MTCTTCKHSIHTTVYPKLYCLEVKGYVDQHQSCPLYETSKEEALKHMTIAEKALAYPDEYGELA